MATDVFEQVTAIGREALARGDAAYAVSLLAELPSPPARRALIEALGALEDDERLIAEARRYCADYGRDAEVCFQLGMAYFRLDDLDSARLAFTGAALLDFDRVLRGIDLDGAASARQRALLGVLCDALANVQERIAQITRECALLGRAQANLSPRAEAVIGALLAEREQAVGTHPPPPSWFEGKTHFEAAKVDPGKNLLLVCYGREGESDRFPYSSVWPPFERSAREAGLNVSSFNGRDFQYHQLPPIEVAPEQRRAALLDLKARIAATGPDLVLFDGTYFTGPNTVDQNFMDELNTLDPPLVSILYDVDHVYNLDVNFWTRNSKLVLTFARSLTVACAAQPERILQWPCMPYPASLFRRDLAKDLSFAYVGHGYRARIFFLMAMRAVGFDPAVQLTHMAGERDLAYQDYAQFLGRTAMTFNTGRLMGNEGIVTGRLIEGILSGTLVFEEIGSGADRLFHPFLHYVPIANVHQLVTYAQYFLKHPERRERIVSNAFAWYDSYLNPTRLWAALFEKMARHRTI